jgi:CheY-like chemotaxis protein/HPt (histidine-containing phosphotransfer) domain-containing protein
MGGRLSVRSEISRGSSFFFSADFRLPAGPAPIALQPEELQGLRALVVDDNGTNRMILEELLVNWGMSAVVVDGGERALAELEKAEGEKRPFAIALLDVMMPRMDGFDLAARIRQQPAYRNMRILMLTSAGRTDAEDMRERLDISRILLKPTKHSDLQSAMTEALGVGGGRVEAPSDAGPADLAPRKILLVEDNPVNRKVALELLGRRTHRVEVATNGQEAVDALAEQSFDVVLMDVHMPVMDGLTATRIIREREHGSGRHVPIVALTAGATAEDREHCLAAGMDNFISKPFRAEQLFQAVEAVAAEALPAPVQQRITSSTAASDDEPCLDWAGALRNLEGDEEFLRELVDMFLTQYPALLAAVEEAVGGEDGDALKRAAHALKGSAQVIGGKATAAAALQLENLGEAGNLSEAKPALGRLRETLSELKTALLAELPEGTT